jgi:hypothetical protein
MPKNTITELINWTSWTVWIWTGYFGDKKIQRSYKTFIMRFLGTHGPTELLLLFFFIFLWLDTYREQNISKHQNIILLVTKIELLPQYQHSLHNSHRWNLPLPTDLPTIIQKFMKNGNMVCVYIHDLLSRLSLYGYRWNYYASSVWVST